MKILNKIISLCENHGFLKRTIYPKIKKEILTIQPIGALLQENLRTEYLFNMVFNRDFPMFLNNGNMEESLSLGKRLCLGEVPFGIFQEVENKKSLDLTEKQKMEFCSFFDNSRLFKSIILITPSSSTQFFYQWQRQRRMWWRKLSASPGRYTLTDIKNDNGNQSVDIEADYPWGKQLVENITLHVNGFEKVSNNLQVKDGKKQVQPYIVVSTVCFSTMLLNFLCDAYEEPLFQKSPRPLLRFHRKLAPYKISFSIPSLNRVEKSIADELKELALYLGKQLRSNNISTLLLPSSFKHTLDTQWKQYDQMGVPYNILLNESTLKNGIVFLRNRDTTLKEHIHVTELVDYVEKLFKNY